jgi:hypothetical protein
VTKKAVVAITFREESSEITNDELAFEIFNELNKVESLFLGARRLILSPSEPKKLKKKVWGMIRG